MLCETVILHIILYGYEIWIHNLKEEHKLRMYENKVLRKTSDRWRNKRLEKIT